MFDLSLSFDRNQLANQILQDIEAATKYNLADDPRKHLGASVVGHPCEQKSWLSFRWCKFEEFEGRMLRLFNRGHEEEKRFIKWLQWIGFEIYEINPATNKQFTIVGSLGHFGGSLDSIGIPPERYGLGRTQLLPEYKTHNDKSFKSLRSKKLLLSKPQHYRQMCSYGKAYNIQYGLYCAVNKDTDELHFEIVELDFSLADDLYRKADNIIFSQRPRPKIAQSKAFFDCKYCDMSGICHDGEAPTKNCRSCIHAFPVENAKWYCEVHAETIPNDIIPIGCNSWTRII